INFDSHHWQIQTTDGTFLGQYLIGADGVTGSMTQWLGLKQQRPHPGLVLEITGLEPPPP
ncbi:MAG: dehydrogenase, partial [Synechococcales cyanobacterium]